jgi:hypothetical protein
VSSLEHVLKIYYERESVWRISWTHQSFGMSGDHEGKSLKSSETLVFEVYAGCSEPRCMYIHKMNKDMACTMDEVM